MNSLALRVIGAFLVLLLIAMPLSPADTCMDAVKIAIRAASSMNEQWHSSCLTAATTEAGKALCETVYAEYKKVFKKHE